MPDDADSLVTAVLTASRVLVSVSARSLAAVEDRLSLTQFRALVVLSAQDETNLHRLATRLGVAASSALRTVDRLVALDLVTRTENPDSRREVLLGLTRQGRRVVDDATDRRREEIADVLARMPAKARTDLVRAFESFSRAAGEPVAGGPAPVGW